ncbi:MAG TPA: hypothetical protein VF041_10345 [Gemmatimonadaceae bacterium]
MRPERRLLALASAFAALLACTKVSTDASAPVAIELRPPAMPSVLRGDVMRNEAGDTARLQAVVFNAHNDTIPDAPVQFLVLDTTGTIAVDQATGIVTGRDTGSAMVIAVITGLQSIPDTIAVVDTPTTLLQLDTLPDSLRFTFTGRDTVRTMRVRLLHVSGTDTVPVPHFAVRYAFAWPAGLDNTDSLAVQIVDDARRPSLVDTTDGTGTASRSLRIAATARAFSDSVIVVVTPAGPPGTPVSGQNLRLVTHLTIQ